MTTPNDQSLPDPEADVVRDMTLADIAAVLEGEGLEYRVEEPVVRTGFVNAAMVFTFDDGKLVFESVWRGEFAPEEVSSLLYATNEFNQTHFTPTLRFFQSEEDTLAITGIRTIDVSKGLSTNQLGAFIVTSIHSTMQAFSFLAETFPTAVTWEEN
ncbi:YbjN domain-containing protein [Corynebacterium urinipleomorphum]|uniref:YbjN domain-containing protein n=1 Tax=Corynebacterium urinipleomorphum TaxID=1852380 RepID=UPI000B34D3D5|nr:YbjN domain-containing protein [Corynebacterium urinipleomorphum]